MKYILHGITLILMTGCSTIIPQDIEENSIDMNTVNLIPKDAALDFLMSEGNGPGNSCTIHQNGVSGSFAYSDAVYPFNEIKITLKRQTYYPFRESVYIIPNFYNQCSFIPSSPLKIPKVVDALYSLGAKIE